ncbi:MAG: hypothetical protein FWC51_01105 [Proteobacteria bacterium]|nr:hypothetical protein [Pseudomonadota bacterium]
MKFFKSILLAMGCGLVAVSAFADPIAPAPAIPAYTGPNPRAGATPATPTASRAAGAAGTQTSPRTVASRGGATVAPGAGNAAPDATRAVSMRGLSQNTTRAVTARVGMIAAGAGTPVASANRVSVTGNAMVVPRAGVAGTGTSGLYSALYTGSYSNIIDPNTGLISADAYSNCLNSYYTCMDEICTARKPGQKRCACAGRVKTFADTETQLDAAKQDLIKISGELALFIASKGRNVSAAFTLTDAEKVMNCAAWHDMTTNGSTPDQMTAWCQSHNMFDANTCSKTVAPTYCTDTSLGGTNWVDTLNGSSSDIIASLQQYASTINSINTITTANNNALINSMQTVNQVLASISGMTGTAVNLSTTSVDTLANTWGYDLFAYAHNNVCNRVLDSCFNGIFEACGSHKTSPDGTTASGNGPFNYNSFITVSNNDVSFTTPSTAGGSSNNASAACYGYTSGTDPYTTLRQPVADARRSILQKYALDANADCDAYSDNLKTQVQTVQYQKIAATQALQQKRLQFATDAATQIATDATNAKTNFSQCLSELLDCYTTQNTAQPTWTTARIKTYCAQIANVPHCYQTMMCNPTSGINVVNAVIDKPDVTSGCVSSADPTVNTCRNIVTLGEILADNSGLPANASVVPATGNSYQIREFCIRQILGNNGAGGWGIRNWTALVIAQ